MSFNTALTILGIPMADAQASYFRLTGETVRIRPPRAIRAPEIPVPSGIPVVSPPVAQPEVQGRKGVKRARGGQIISPSGIDGTPEKDKENRNGVAPKKIRSFRIDDILGIPDVIPDEEMELDSFLARGMSVCKKELNQFLDSEGIRKADVARALGKNAKYFELVFSSRSVFKELARWVLKCRKDPSRIPLTAIGKLSTEQSQLLHAEFQSNPKLTEKRHYELVAACNRLRGKRTDYMTIYNWFQRRKQPSRTLKKMVV